MEIDVTVRTMRDAMAAPKVPSPGPEGAGPVPPFPGLSARQLRIMELAAEGLTNAEIARALYLSVATVERHCTTMYRTLGVRNRVQALAVLARLSPMPPADALDGRRGA